MIGFSAKSLVNLKKSENGRLSIPETELEIRTHVKMRFTYRG